MRRTPSNGVQLGFLYSDDNVLSQKDLLTLADAGIFEATGATPDGKVIEYRLTALGRSVCEGNLFK